MKTKCEHNRLLNELIAKNVEHYLNKKDKYFEIFTEQPFLESKNIRRKARYFNGRFKI